MKENSCASISFNPNCIAAWLLAFKMLVNLWVSQKMSLKQKSRRLHFQSSVFVYRINLVFKPGSYNTKSSDDVLIKNLCHQGSSVLHAFTTFSKSTCDGC